LNEFGWASAVGHIRVKEKELMSRADLMRVAEAHDLDRALHALRDTYYGPYVASVKDPANFGEALVEALSDIYDYCLGIGPEPMLIAAYRARNDFHNLKVKAKSVNLGTPAHAEAFSYMGNIDPGELLAASSQDTCAVAGAHLSKSDISSLTRALRETYAEADALAASEKGSIPEALLALKVDSLVDRRYYEWFAKVFKRFGYPGMSDFVRAEVDLLNLRMSTRALRMGMSPALFRDVVLPGGTVPADTVALAYEGGLGAIEAAFRWSPWSTLAALGAEVAKRKESLTKWEKACDDALMGVARRAKYYSLGPEPVFGYLFAKEAEVRNLRVILSGKQSSVPSQEIAERLREPYV
jgi:V/A-type H+-transporting ATPase subunit C